MIKRLLLTALLPALLFTASCTDNPPIVDIPPALVNIDINLNNFQYQALRIDGGFVTEPGGVRGIIIYRQSAGLYRAFERNCTFEPRNTCATVEVDPSGFFMIDPCCSSTFSFPEGFPTGGPATVPLREYTTILDGNFLFIRN